VGIVMKAICSLAAICLLGSFVMLAFVATAESGRSARRALTGAAIGAGVGAVVDGGRGARRGAAAGAIIGAVTR